MPERRGSDQFRSYGRSSAARTYFPFLPVPDDQLFVENDSIVRPAVQLHGEGKKLYRRVCMELSKAQLKIGSGSGASVVQVEDSAVMSWQGFCVWRKLV